MGVCRPIAATRMLAGLTIAGGLDAAPFPSRRQLGSMGWM
jgi:hypothetical protein